MFLNRTEFFYEMRDVLYGEKPQSSGFVNITDVLDFIYDLGLEDATLLAFEEEEKSTKMVFEFDESDSSQEDCDTE